MRSIWDHVNVAGDTNSSLTWNWENVFRKTSTQWTLGHLLTGFVRDSTKLTRPEQTSGNSLEKSCALKTNRREAQTINVKQMVKAQEVTVGHPLFWPSTRVVLWAVLWSPLVSKLIHCLFWRWVGMCERMFELPQWFCWFCCHPQSLSCHPVCPALGKSALS